MPTKINRYKAQRDNLIRLYGELEKFDKTQKALSNSISNLKDDKYKLAITGELSSGKSTFINALIGNELLPTGPDQVTKAVVEIFDSKTPVLRVKYADNHVTLYESNIPEKLQDISAISEKYELIPTKLLDEVIIEKTKEELENEKVKSDDDYIIPSLETKIEVTEELLEQLIADTGLEHLHGQKELIEEYFNEFSIADIPEFIEVGYPLKWDFEQIRILDTPGVNALGNYYYKSLKTINKADAYIFICPPDKIDSQSFRKFIQNQLSENSREKKPIFFILTKVSGTSDDRVERMLNKARAYCGDLIADNKFIYVDSLYKVIYDNLEAGFGFDEIRKSGPEKSNLIAEMELKAKEKREERNELIFKYSNFKTLIKTLDLFIYQEPFKNLHRIAERIKLAFDELNKIYGEQLRLKKAEYKDPHTFDSVIRKARKDLKAWNEKLIHIPENIEDRYGSNYIHDIIEKLQHKYSEQFTTCKNFKELDEKVYDAVESLQGARNSYESKIEAEIERLVDKEQIEFTKDTGGYNPKPNLERWKSESRETALKDEYMTVTESLLENWNWARFKWTRNSRTRQEPTGNQIIDQEAYLSASRDKASNWFISERVKLNKNLSELRKNKLTSFEREINKTVRERDEHLQDLLKKKSDNKEVKKQIELLKGKIKTIKSHIMTAKQIEGATHGTD